MDVYQKDGFQQIFLLHIPYGAAFVISSKVLVEFRFANGDQKFTLVEMARKSFDDKLQMDIHPRSLDKRFCHRMEYPIGMSDKYKPICTSPTEVNEGSSKSLGKLILKLSASQAPEKLGKVTDSFSYQGLDGRVCKNCIHSLLIQGNGECCGRLYCESFRKRYKTGIWEFRKTENPDS